MPNPEARRTDPPASQQAVRARCVHPTGHFVEFPRADVEGTLSERFARQVARHPDRVAIKTRSHELTYRALGRAVTQVARRLRERLGDGPQAVGLLFEQGAPAIWAALGTLAAGKTCVPLDPAHPRARTAFILEDSEAQVVLADRAGANRAREGGRDLGGDSLLAAKILARVREAMTVDVPVRLLLESPTVAAMALAVLDRRIAMEHVRGSEPDGAPRPSG